MFWSRPVHLSMINPSSQPTIPQIYTELRLVSSRVRWLKRACMGMALLVLAASVMLWVAPSGASWGL
jgi:hypothetical protein